MQIINIIKNNKLECLSICIAIAGILVIFNTYYPFYDESWQLQAAFRLLKHGELTGSMGILINWNNKDLSNNYYSFITNWPPGYSFSIALISLLGFSIITSAKIFAVTIYLVLLYYWYLIINIIIKSKFLNTIAFIIISLFAIKVHHTNLAVLTIYSTITYIIIKQREKSISFTTLALLSILASVAILFRYQAIILIPSLFLFVIYWVKDNLKARILKSFLLVLLPITTYLCIFFINRILGTDLWTEIVTESPLSFRGIWFLWALKSIFLETTNLDKIIIALMKHLGLISYTNFILYIISFLICIALIITSVRNYKLNNNRVLISWFLASFTINIFFLLLISIIQYDNNSKITALNVSRYYMMFIPLFIAILVSYIDIKKIRLLENRVVKNISLITLLIVGIFYVTNEFKASNSDAYYKNREVILNTINNIERSEKISKSLVLTTKKSGIHTYLIVEDNYPVFRYLNNIESLYFTEPTLVIFILDESNIKDEDITTYTNIIKNKKLKFLNNSTFNFYYKIFSNEHISK